MRDHRIDSCKGNCASYDTGVANEEHHRATHENEDHKGELQVG